MDELDHNLLMAWNRVFERCRADPAEARRRYRRVRAGSVLDRPNRAWCVAVRASDTRLVGEQAVDDPGAAGQMWSHTVTLSAGVVRALGGPVWIRYPGVPLDAAAAELGMHRESLRRWLPVRPGRSRGARECRRAASDFGDLKWQRYEGDDSPLRVRYQPQSTVGRHRGLEVPVVWADGPLDPGAQRGRPPNRWWGPMWQSLAERIPDSFEQVVERVPRYLPYPTGGGESRGRFRGWLWACPGRVSRGMDGGLVEGSCGKLAAKLYAPLPVWTVGRALGLEAGLRVDGGCGMAGGGLKLGGEWLPGVMDRWAGLRSLACERCWKLRRSTFADSTGWNDLVSHLSGGLLYGREVAKPEGFEHERRRAYRPRRKRRAEAPRLRTAKTSTAAAAHHKL